MAAQEFEFANWYDIFIDAVRGSGYHGHIDSDSANNDYNKGLSPEQAANELVEEMNNN